jgi:hypothetical protein
MRTIQQILDEMKDQGSRIDFQRKVLPIALGVCVFILMGGLGWREILASVAFWFFSWKLLDVIGLYTQWSVNVQRLFFESLARGEMGHGTITGEGVSSPTMDEFQKFVDGTCRFSFDNNAYVARVVGISLATGGGAGMIHLQLDDLHFASGEDSGDNHGTLELDIPLFLASVTRRPRETVIEFMAPQDKFGSILSFRVKD